MLNKLSLRFRLIFAFASIALVLFIVGGIGVNSLTRIRTKYEHVITVVTPKVIHLTQMRWSMEKLLSIVTQMGLYGTSPEDLATLGNELKTARQAYTEAEKQYQSLKFSEGEQGLYDQVAEKWGLVLGFMVDALPLARSAKPEDKIKFAVLYRGEFKNARHQFYQALENLIQFQTRESAIHIESAQKSSNTSTSAMVIFSLFGFIISIAVGAIVSRIMASRLSLLADRLSKGADRLSGAADQIASAGEELLASLDSQSSAIHETTAAMDEINSMVGKSAENASISRTVSISSDEKARACQKSMDDMLHAIHELEKSSDQVMEQMNTNTQSFMDINQVISEIGNQTKIINDIVFQTKLLSFNASVEAARAGEHGQGFSVVAEEVGNLAQMSGRAAKDIQQMINSSISKVHHIVEISKTQVTQIISHNRKKLNEGKLLASECKSSLTELVSNVTQVRSMVEEISSATQEQATGLTDVTKSMGVINQSTQESAKSSRMTSQASEQLASQANELRGVVSTLNQTVHGSGNAKSELEISSTSPPAQNGSFENE
jgi:methyl-accepting chemotaxis protein